MDKILSEVDVTNMAFTKTRGLYYKTFYGRNLQIFVMS
jgi:hypothetical protein